MRIVPPQFPAHRRLRRADEQGDVFLSFAIAMENGKLVALGARKMGHAVWEEKVERLSSIPYFVWCTPAGLLATLAAPQGYAFQIRIWVSIISF